MNHPSIATLRIFLLLFCAWPALAAAQAPDESADAVAEAVTAEARWAKDLGRCPADVFAPDKEVSPLRSPTCKASLGACLKQCKSGAGAACYWLAVELQQQDARLPEKVAAPLYHRACTLGIASACTNRAAGMMSTQPGDSADLVCATRTFKLTCEADDPWGCTMYAFNLSRGIGTRTDLRAALAALKRSCKYGEEDEACTSGIGLRKEIEAALAAKAD
jgi:TPR repeat protein